MKLELLGLTALMTSMLWTCVSDASEPVWPRKVMCPLVKWCGSVENADLEKLAPKSWILNSQKDFAKLWKAWRMGDSIANVDFDSCFVVIVTKQKQSTDLIGLILKDGGDWEVGVLSDAEKQNLGFGYSIGVFPYEKVKRVHGKLIREE